jgi:hypothetical protein
MTLRAGEFIRRFLLHVLPKGFHRIRHLYNIINNVRKDLAVLPSYRPPSSNGFHIPFRLSVGPAVKPRFQAIWRGLVEGKLQFASAPASASSQRREKDRPEHSDDRVFAHRIARAPGRGGRKGRDAAGADQQAEKKAADIRASRRSLKRRLIIRSGKSVHLVQRVKSTPCRHSAPPIDPPRTFVSVDSNAGPCPQSGRFHHVEPQPTISVLGLFNW